MEGSVRTVSQLILQMHKDTGCSRTTQCHRDTWLDLDDAGFLIRTHSPATKVMRVTAEIGLYSDVLIFFGGSDGEREGVRLKHGARIRFNNSFFLFFLYCRSLKKTFVFYWLANGNGALPRANCMLQNISKHFFNIMSVKEEETASAH